MRIKRVAIIGAGPACRPDGMTLALACGRAGFSVVLEDVLPGNLRAAVAAVGDEQKGYMPRLATSIEDAVRDADLVLDTVPDELESKLEILSLLDRMAPPAALFLTPTRMLSIADLAACTYRPGQCFGLVFASELPAPGWQIELTTPPAADAAHTDLVVSFLGELSATVNVVVDRSQLHS